MIVIAVTLFLQLAAAGMALRLFWLYGRRWAWTVLCALLLGLTFQTCLLIPQTHPNGQTSLVQLQADGAALVMRLILIGGMVIMEQSLLRSRREEEALHREKHQLAALVDRRLADLEAEVGERRRAEQDLRRDGERFSSIITTQYDIATAKLDLQAVMDLIALRTQDLTQATGVVIELLEGETLTARAASGRAAAFLELQEASVAGLSRECVRTGEILCCNDAERDPRADLHLCRRLGARSLIVVPLLYDGRPVGVMQVQSPELYAFSAMDVHTLQLMAGLIGAAMSHSAEFEAKQVLLSEAIERADRDPLTGLLNHRAFHNRLHEEADRAQRDGQTLAIAVIDMDNFKFFNDAYGHQVGDEVLRTVAAALASVCRSYDTLARFGGDEFALLMPCVSKAEAEELERRLACCLDGTGYRPAGYDVTIPLSLSVGMAVFPDDAPSRLEVLEAADARLRRVKYGASDGVDLSDYLRSRLPCSMGSYSILSALVTAVDNKDRYTRRHSEDVMNYSLQIAQALGMDDEAQDTVRIAALLHDVGKIGVPDAILRKPGTLTEGEVRAVQQHPMMGSIIVGAVPGFEATLEAVRHHHERWDGNGYPMGLKGEETPLIARLMAVADSYSAMTTDRPYRKGMDAAKALSILEAGIGTQWDPQCVAAFLSVRRPLLEASFVTVPRSDKRLTLQS